MQGGDRRHERGALQPTLQTENACSKGRSTTDLANHLSRQGSNVLTVFLTTLLVTAKKIHSGKKQILTVFFTTLRVTAE